MRDALTDEEEALRAAVEALPAADRQAYYDLAHARFKDPDLYATLAYVFISGLHHFYLERWGRGLLDLGLNVVGIALVVVGAIQASLALAVTGAILVAGVAIVELRHLFESQAIVRRYNLERQREILEGLRRRTTNWS